MSEQTEPYLEQNAVFCKWCGCTLGHMQGDGIAIGNLWLINAHGRCVCGESYHFSRARVKKTMRREEKPVAS